MSKNVYCPGQKYITEDYKDGWMRTYKGYPSMNADVKKMLREYAKDGYIPRIIIFFFKVCELDYEYSMFLTREVIRGYI